MSDEKKHDGEEETYYAYGPYKAPKEDANPSVFVYSSAEQGKWNYSSGHHKAKFKSLVATFLAGVVLTGAGMYYFSNNYIPTQNTVMTVTEKPSPVRPTSGNKLVNYQSLGKPTDVSSIAKSAGPAVVKIETLVKVNTQSSMGGMDSSDSIWQYFFGGGYTDEVPQDKAPLADQKDQYVALGSGSGFIFEKEGYILTNEHVVNGAEKLQVYLQGTPTPYEGKILGTNPNLDLAVIKIEGKEPFTTLELGDSDQIQVGEGVVAIGNPYGLDHTVTTGVLSAKERMIPGVMQDRKTGKTQTYLHLLQTDASINPGNSGGPLINMSGQVIGINVMKAGASGIGFAIPSNEVKKVVQNLKENKPLPLPGIGIVFGDLRSPEYKRYNFKVDKGVIIRQVEYGSPAYKAGLNAYDIIVAIDGVEIQGQDELIKKIQSKNIGDKINLSIIRDESKKDIEVTIGDLSKIRKDINN